MSIERKALLIVLALLALALTLATIAGCAAQMKNTPQPQLDPVEGASVMFVPEGCKIGDIAVPENGIFIGESILIEQMRKEREAEQRKRRERT